MESILSSINFVFAHCILILHAMWQRYLIYTNQFINQVLHFSDIYFIQAKTTNTIETFHNNYIALKAFDSNMCDVNVFIYPFFTTKRNNVSIRFFAQIQLETTYYPVNIFNVKYNDTNIEMYCELLPLASVTYVMIQQ